MVYAIGLRPVIWNGLVPLSCVCALRLNPKLSRALNLKLELVMINLILIVNF